MNNINSIAVESVIKKLQILEITVMIAASIFIQFIIHIIPAGGQAPLGAILLPMFYVPLIALIFYNFQAALIVTTVGPIINYFLTGSPKLEIVPLLTFELLVFVLILALLLKSDRINKVSALIAIISAKLASWSVFSLFNLSGFSASFFINSLIIAIPGIIVLVLMNILLLYIKDRL